MMDTAYPRLQRPARQFDLPRSRLRPSASLWSKLASQPALKVVREAIIESIEPKPTPSGASGVSDGVSHPAPAMTPRSEELGPDAMPLRLLQLA